MKNWQKYIIYIVVGVVVVVGVTRLRILVVSNGYTFTQNQPVQVEDCQNLVVLGAGVRDDGSMTPILEERANTARYLYENNKACTIIISGDTEEVEAVEKYLIEKNIQKDSIILDGNGIDTFTSMKNMRDIFKLKKAIIITHDFHILRAIYIARVLGIDATGYVVHEYYPYGTLEKQKYIIRDWLTSLKAVAQAELIKN